MKLLYTLCWVMICIGIILIIGTLAYDILYLDTLTIENARSSAEVKRDTVLILTGAAITLCSALSGIIVGFFVKSETLEETDSETAT